MRPLLAVFLFALSSAAQACSFGAGKVESFRLYFEFGEFKVTEMTGAMVDAVASQLDGCRVVVVVSGHRDSSETGVLEDVRLDDLGQARADAVRQRLLEKGFAPADIVVRDMKFDRPAVPTPAGTAEARNRRVELTVVSL